MAMRRIAGKDKEAAGAVGASAAEVKGEADDEQSDKHATHKPRGKPRQACRDFMLSPYWQGMMITLVALVPLGAFFVLMPKVVIAMGCKSFLSKAKHYFLCLYISTMFLFNFISAQLTNPGRVTDQQKPTVESTGQFQMEFGDEDPKQSKYTQIGLSEPLMYAPNYCKKCRHWKPPRTHHCSVCQACTLRMDHHCPFTGNCIGLNNHGHFVLMYMWAIIGCLYSFGLCAVTIYGMHVFRETIGRIPRAPQLSSLGWFDIAQLAVVRLVKYTDVNVGVQLVMTCIALSAVLGLGGHALVTAARGRTMVEVMFPSKEYVQIESEVLCPLGTGFYSAGWRQNFRDILGPSWLRRLFLPVAGAPPDWHVGVAPRPGCAGSEALMQRIQQIKKEGAPAGPPSPSGPCGPPASSARDASSAGGAATAADAAAR